MQNLKLRTRGTEKPIVYAPIVDGQIRDEVEAASRRFLLEDRQNLKIVSQEIYNVDHNLLGPNSREVSDFHYEHIETPPQEPSEKPAKRSLFRYSGWRKGVAVGIALSALVLVINVSLAIAAGKGARSLNGQIATMYEGNCGKVRKLSLWLHLLINVLSSLILGASNYCMQVLCAPTRENIDTAHRRKEWMHIGVQSVRNIGALGGGNLILWALLVLSSLPLHLL